MTEMRNFETGATRDGDVSKFDYEGFLSPYALEAFAAYMNFNRITANGRRDSDNWQKGIPLHVYIKSAWRHFFELWQEHRGITTKEGIVWALCALLFNVQGYLHELLKANPYLLTQAIARAEKQRATSEPRRKTSPNAHKANCGCADCTATIDCVPAHAEVGTQGSMTAAVRKAARGKRRG